MANYNFLVDIEIEVLGVVAESKEAAEAIVQRELSLVSGYTTNLSLTYLGEDEE